MEFFVFTFRLPILCYALFLITKTLSAKTSFENLTFSLPNFNPNCHEIVYEGNASPSNGVIQLTTNQRDKLLNGSTGRATYKQPMHLWESGQRNLADFTTHFSFSIDSQGSSLYGDGFVFFLTPNGSRLPGSSAGGNFGLLTSNPKDPDYSKAKFLAVEFDTFSNGWDPYGNHIGIDLNIVTSMITTSLWWSDIKHGGRVHAQVSYSSSAHNLTVFLFDERDSGGSPRNYSSLSYIIDLREYLPEWVTIGFSGATGSFSEIHSIYSWNFTSRLQMEADITDEASPPMISPSPLLENSMNRMKTMNKKWLRIIMGAVFVLCLILGLTWFMFWIRRNGRKQSERRDQEADFEMETGPKSLSYKDLFDATAKFNESNVLGEGGFGKVYKGFLKDKKCDVAVKRITPNNDRQGSKEFASEVKTISKLQHKNLVKLIGWCCKNQEYLIVYKFMPNKSLDFHLFEQNNLLTWENRYKIATGLASALHYLQEEQDPYILHRDIKSSNVLLDAEFNAKLGDFGLAKPVVHGQQSKTTILLGTEGYIAPEYLESKEAGKESDIYSFGVVCLEIACGKRAIGEVMKNGEKSVIKLVEWVWDHYRREKVIEAADPKLGQEFKEEEMKQLLVIGIACAQPDYSLRPSIKEVIEMLNFRYSPTIPKEYPGTSTLSAFVSAHMEMIRNSFHVESEQCHSFKAFTPYTV